MAILHRTLALLSILTISLATLPALAADCAGVAAWNATTTYVSGNTMTYNGSLYRANITVTNTTPDYCVSCGWYTNLGVCSTGSSSSSSSGSSTSSSSSSSGGAPYGHTITSDNVVTFRVNNAPWADLHVLFQGLCSYSTQQDIRMTHNADNSNTYVVTLSPGMTIEYNFTIGNTSGGSSNTAATIFRTNGISDCGGSSSSSSSGGGTTIKILATQVVTGTSIPTTWGIVGTSTVRDWIGVYTPTGADGAPLDKRYTSSCLATPGTTAKPFGWCKMSAPTTSGTYHVRLFANDGFTRLATSGNVIVGLTSGGSGSSSSSSSSSGGAICNPGIKPYIKVGNGSWQQTNTVTIPRTSSVTFGPQPTSGGTWRWSGPNGYTSSSRQITVSVSSTSVYTVTYTNASGCVSTMAFRVNVGS